MSTEESKELRKLLDEAKVKMGAYSFRLAEEFLLKYKNQLEHGSKRGVQERISFVKMEYFLYAFSEAFRLMKEITHYTNFINQLEKDIE